jgi:predicted histidine transporter YuiF (NhaC family)
MLWLIFWGFWGTMIAAANTALVLTDLAARAARANPDLLLGSVNFESMGLFLTFVIGGSFGLVLLIAQLAWDLGAQIEAEIEASIRRWRLRLDNRRASVRSVDPA